MFVVILGKLLPIFISNLGNIISSNTRENRKIHIPSNANENKLRGRKNKGGWEKRFGRKKQRLEIQLQAQSTSFFEKTNKKSRYLSLSHTQT